MRYLVFAIVVLAGCGGRADVTDPVSRADQATALSDYWSGQNMSDPAQLPRGGSVKFVGLTTLGLPIGDTGGSYTGDLALTVRFGSRTNPVSGSIANLGNLDGDLQIGSGFLDRGADADVDYTFGAEVNGTLTSGDAAYVVDGDMLGDLRGRTQDGVTGIIYGDVTGPDGQALFQGSFAGDATD